MIWTIPCLLSVNPKNVRLKSLTFSSRVTHCVRESASLMKLEVSFRLARVVVGIFCEPYRQISVWPNMIDKGQHYLRGRWLLGCNQVF